MPTLDTMVSRVVSRARLLERAMHRRDGWAIQRGNLTLPARRVLGDDRIMLEAEFPAGEYNEDVWLLLDGETQSYRNFPPLSTGPYMPRHVFRWEIIIEGAESR